MQFCTYSVNIHYDSNKKKKYKFAKKQKCHVCFLNGISLCYKTEKAEDNNLKLLNAAQRPHHCSLSWCLQIK